MGFHASSNLDSYYNGGLHHETGSRPARRVQRFDSSCLSRAFGSEEGKVRNGREAGKTYSALKSLAATFTEYQSTFLLSKHQPASPALQQ